MQTVFLLFLFILQLISFYFMALLYMRLSKFNNLEKKQEKLMAEMDDAIGAYLSELKEENERLIQIIDKRYDNADVRSTAAATIQSAEPERQLEKKPHSHQDSELPNERCIEILPICTFLVYWQRVRFGFESYGIG